MNHPSPFRKSSRSRLHAGLVVALVTAASLACGPIRADDGLAAKTLKEQGRFWKSQGRLDLAAPAWKLLLQLEPRNPEALEGIAQFELANNQPDAARAIVDELKRQPELNRDAIRRIENTAARRPINAEQLEQARAAARAGKAQEAVDLYRQVFGDGPPTGPVALEYYQTLGGTANGWDPARQGLERLNAIDPNNAVVALAYAQHLTYRADTRRQGIRLLADLARSPQVQSPALSAWRQALIWLQASNSDIPLFRAYLGVQPNDDAIRARVASLNQVSAPSSKPLSASSLALRDAFKALDGGNVGVAEQRFESLLQASPRNADALGGLGVVRLKQERMAEAESLLSEALRISKDRKWAKALNASRFWLAMQEGQTRLDENNLALTKAAFERAHRLDPSSPLPQAALIRALVRFDQTEEAQNLVDAIKDGTERREIGRQLTKSRVIKAMDAKQYADAERLLAAQGGKLDVQEQELLAWAQYHQGKLSDAARGFASVYRVSATQGAASGLVFTHHKQKTHPALLALAQPDTGPLRALVPLAVQQKIAQGETRFDVNSQGQLSEIDPVVLLTEDVFWPATLALLKEKNPQKAYDLLLPYESKVSEIGDFGLLVVLGESAALIGDQPTALRTLQKASEETEDETYYFTWARALIKFDRHEEAEPIMVKQLETLDADGLTLLGWTQARLGKYDQAAERMATAYGKQPSKEAAEALIFTAYQANKFPLILSALDKQPDGPLSALVAPEVRTRIAAGEQRFGLDANARLVAMQGGNSAQNGFSLKLEPHLRSKSDVAGEGELRQGGVIATLGWQGQTQRASLEVERQSASDAIDRARGQRWYAKWGMKMASNLDLQVGVGRTLSGGAVRQATVGEVGLGYSVPEGGVGVRLFRRGSEESLLALAGTPDVTTGVRWGRVLERGMALNAYYKGDRWDSLASLVVSRLDGRTVADNRKVELYARALHPIDAVAGLSLGPEVYLSQFRRNLSAFEPGHGGYFSPSRSATLGGMGRYETSLGSMALTLTAGLGWNRNREAAAAGNPITGAQAGKYPAATGSGLAYHGRIEGLQPLDSHWVLGFGLGLQRSAYFADRRANVFVQRNWGD